MPEEIKQTLDIPQGVFFSISDNSLILGNESDVVIRGDLGYKLKKIFSNKGGIQLFPPDGVELVIEQVEAPNGDIFISGKVKCKKIKGKKVHFNEGILNAESIEGREEVILKGKHFNLFLVNAPHVHVDGDSTGMALVVQCKNEIPKKRFTGGFKNMDEAKRAFDNLMKVTSSVSETTVTSEPKKATAPVEKPPPLQEEKIGGGPDEKKMSAELGQAGMGGEKKDSPPSDPAGAKNLFRRRL